MGADILAETVLLRESHKQLLEWGKMTLCKWRSSSKDLKKRISPELLEKEESLLISVPAFYHKALGVHWDT